MTDTYVVDSDVVVQGVLSKLRLGHKAKLVLGVDSETIRFDPLIKPNRLRLLQMSTGDVTAVFDTWKLGPLSVGRIVQFLEDPETVKVFHNAKFDLKFLMHCLGLGYCWPIFDTQLAAQLQDLGDKYGKHDLEYCVQHYLNVQLDKDIGHQWSGDLSRQQIIYASNDAAVLPPLRAELLRLGKERRLIAAYVLEFEAIQPTAIMELNGFLLDRDKWDRITADTKARRQVVAEKLMAMLPPRAGDTPGLFDGISSFNLDSDEQLKERLTEMGIDLPKLVDDETGEERDTMGSEKMAQISHQHPIIPLVIEHSQLSTAVTSYGKKFLDNINPHDGRAHADFRQLGTVTSRYSVKKPPLHGIPKRSDHRECFIARPGYKLVWADYSQIELRILAEFSQDKKMIQAFVDGEDFHNYTASDLYKIDPRLVDGIQRRRAKDLNFGVVYGVGDKRFAEKAGIEIEQAKVLRGRYAKTYPEMNTYLNNAAGSARVNGFCQTMSGKIITFVFDRNDPKQVSAVERHGKNYPIQGSSADITKRALKLLYDEVRGGDLLEQVRLVHCVHDEIVLEVRDDYIERAKVILKTSMVSAGKEFLKTVPVVVDTETNDFWKKRKDE